MWRFLLLIFLVALMYPTSTRASEVNAGFVQGLWYSSPEFFAGAPVRIYVALRNNTEHDLSATIRFTDNNTRIGTSDVHALSGRLVEAWVDWTPTQGEHTIVATVSDAQLHIIGGGTQQIDINGMLAEDTLTVDIDTDKDGIGNTVDIDDDNDEVNDNDEKARGTDPLVANPQVETKKTQEKDIEKENATVFEDADTKDVPTQSTNVTSARSGGRGIEQYLDDGAAAAILSNVTDKVENAKTSLDEYREERNATIAHKRETKETNPTGGGQVGEITRTKIESQDNSLLNSFIGGVRAIMESIWTFVLFALSYALGYPALMQFLLLLFIVVTIFLTARRLARRPNTYT